ncbi:unnamed protein product [Parnassius apollo]|uniref:(apollo) hypothetical protein n=1 Tax=Parnassius apollo TaxID=110799 RepID=A0A8S3WFY9_PARAO|nr:unnamed protein product [Parnassius apollo]
MTRVAYGITFHRFPKDPDIKEKWINITGRQDWFPTKNSRICSVHFQEYDFDETAKKRNLMKSSIPTLNIWKLYSKNSTPNIPLTSAVPVTSTLPSTPSRKRVFLLPSSNNSENRPSIDIDTPREKKLRRIIETNKYVITRQRLMIKRLQCKTRRYKKINLELKTMLKNLENKRLTTGDKALSLENMN